MAKQIYTVEEIDYKNASMPILQVFDDMKTATDYYNNRVHTVEDNFDYSREFARGNERVSMHMNKKGKRKSGKDDVAYLILLQKNQIR